MISMTYDFLDRIMFEKDYVADYIARDLNFSEAIDGWTRVDARRRQYARRDNTSARLFRIEI